jgi:hypothetical protein
MCTYPFTYPTFTYITTLKNLLTTYLSYPFMTFTYPKLPIYLPCFIQSSNKWNLNWKNHKLTCCIFERISFGICVNDLCFSKIFLKIHLNIHKIFLFYFINIRMKFNIMFLFVSFEQDLK